MRVMIILTLAIGVAIAVPLDGGLHGGISFHVPGIGEVGMGGELGLSLGHRKPEPQQPISLPGPEPHPSGNRLHPPSAMCEEDVPSHERLPYPDSVPPGFENPLTDPIPPPEWKPREPLNPDLPLSVPIPPEMKPHHESGHEHPLGDPIPSEMKPRLESGYDHLLSDPIPLGMELHDEPGHPLSDPVPPPGLQTRPERSLEDIVPEGGVYPPTNRRRQRMVEEEPLDIETFLLFANFADPDPASIADFLEN